MLLAIVKLVFPEVISFYIDMMLTFIRKKSLNASLSCDPKSRISFSVIFLCVLRLLALSKNIAGW